MVNVDLRKGGRYKFCDVIYHDKLHQQDFRAPCKVPLQPNDENDLPR